MALVYADFTQESTNTTGTGTYTLGGATAPYQAFSVIGDGNTCTYSVTDGTDFEVVLGTYALSGTTLTRDSILSSSNGGSAVNWGAGTKTVSLVHAASHIGQPPLTSTLVDFSDTSHYSVIDDDVANTLIADTTKPASPQYTKTIDSLPASSEVADFYVALSIAGFNNDGSTRTLNFRLTVNGVDVGSSDGSVSVTAARYWRIMFRYNSAALVANDVIGVKMWGSLTNVLDYRAAIIYVIPRTWGPGSSDGQYSLTTNHLTTLQGTIGGATYAAAAITSASVYDDDIPGVVATITAANQSLAAQRGQSLMFFDAASDGSFQQNGGALTLTLNSLSVIRYGRKVLFS